MFYLPAVQAISELSLTVSAASQPVANVDVAILPPVFSLAVIFSVMPRSPVGVAVGVEHVAHAVPLPVHVLASIDIAICPSVLAEAVEDVVPYLSPIASSISPMHDAHALQSAVTPSSCVVETATGVGGLEDDDPAAVRQAAVGFALVDALG